MDPVAATSATAEPEISAKNSDTPTLTMASPPRTKPMSAETKAISRVEMPPVFISAPASTKSGMAISGKLVAPLKIDSAAFRKPREPFRMKTPMSALVRIATAMGTPMAIIANIDRRTSASVIGSSPNGAVPPRRGRSPR